VDKNEEELKEARKTITRLMIENSVLKIEIQTIRELISSRQLETIIEKLETLNRLYR